MGGDATQHLVRNLTKMGWRAGTPICLTGGIGPPVMPTTCPPRCRTTCSRPWVNPP